LKIQGEVKALFRSTTNVSVCAASLMDLFMVTYDCELDQTSAFT